MIIRPVITSPNFAPSASKETSEDDRRSGQERSKQKKKFEIVGKENAAAAEVSSADLSTEENKLVPKSETIIEFLATKNDVPSRSKSQRAFTAVSKVKTHATVEVKLDKKC